MPVSHRFRCDRFASLIGCDCNLDGSQSVRVQNRRKSSFRSGFGFLERRAFASGKLRLPLRRTEQFPTNVSCRELSCRLQIQCNELIVPHDGVFCLFC